MKIISVASTNPVKIEAARRGFTAMFPDETFQCEGVAGVSAMKDQPDTDDETLLGARHRVKILKQVKPEADYWVGIEGGLRKINAQRMEAFAWVVVESREQYQGEARTGSFLIPSAIRDLIDQGKELGEAADIVFQESNSKQKMGSVGILTGNVIDRTTYYTHAVILALIPVKNPTLYL